VSGLRSRVRQLDDGLDVLQRGRVKRWYTVIVAIAVLVAATMIWTWLVQAQLLDEVCDLKVLQETQSCWRYKFLRAFDGPA
jgi:hypothetical protein